MSWQRGSYEHKRQEAKELKEDIREFMKNGGKIKVIPTGLSGAELKMSQKEKDNIIKFKSCI